MLQLLMIDDNCIWEDCELLYINQLVQLKRLSLKGNPIVSLNSKYDLMLRLFKVLLEDGLLIDDFNLKQLSSKLGQVVVPGSELQPLRADLFCPSLLKAATALAASSASTTNSPAL